MFEQSFLPVPARTRRAWTVAVSFLSQVLGIGILVLVPLVLTDSLPKARLQELFTAPPPPPAPPAIRAVQVVSVQRVPVRASNVLVNPVNVPRVAQTIIDPPDVAGPAGPQGNGVGVVGSIPGTGEPSAVIQSIIQTAHRAALAPPPAPPVAERPPERPQRIVIGGNLLSGRLLHSVTPAYPAMARQVRVAGMVRIAAVIGTDGRIRELRVVSGHPLLIQAALDAVRQWVYQPTLLNGVPVEVDSTIDVTFTLQR